MLFEPFGNALTVNSVKEVVKDRLYKQSLGGVARHARGEWGGGSVEGRGRTAHVINTEPKQHQRQLRTSFTFTTQTICKVMHE